MAAVTRPVLIILFIFLLATQSIAETPKKIALVIGNSKYIHLPFIPNAKNDAGDMAEALSEVGFNVFKGIDLDYRAMIEIIGAFQKSLDGADIALLFFAGHGVQFNEVNYLIPVDATLKNEIEVEALTIKLQLIIAAMERAAKNRIIFLDSCRDNPGLINLKVRSSAVGSGLAAENPGTVGTFVTFATNPGNVALDGPGRNSPFTSALKKSIREPGVEIHQMMTRVRKEVFSVTNGSQLPWTNSSLQENVFLSTRAVAR